MQLYKAGADNLKTKTVQKPLGLSKRSINGSFDKWLYKTINVLQPHLMQRFIPALQTEVYVLDGILPPIPML